MCWDERLRVQAVSNELGSERIDIVVWEDDPANFDQYFISSRGNFDNS